VDRHCGRHCNYCIGRILLAAFRPGSGNGACRRNQHHDDTGGSCCSGHSAGSNERTGCSGNATGRCSGSCRTSASNSGARCTGSGRPFGAVNISE